MIVILMKYHGHTLQSAVDYVGELCRGTIDDFNANRKNIPSWGPVVDDIVQRYIQGLQDWIVGYALSHLFLYQLDSQESIEQLASLELSDYSLLRNERSESQGE